MCIDGQVGGQTERSIQNAAGADASDGSERVKVGPQERGLSRSFSLNVAAWSTCSWEESPDDVAVTVLTWLCLSASKRESDGERQTENREAEA